MKKCPFSYFNLGFSGVPLHLFFLSVFFGLMPYNYLCVTSGVLLAEIREVILLWSSGTRVIKSSSNMSKLLDRLEIFLVGPTWPAVPPLQWLPCYQLQY